MPMHITCFDVLPLTSMGLLMIQNADESGHVVFLHYSAGMGAATIFNMGNMDTWFSTL